MRSALTNFITDEWYFFFPLLMMSMSAMALVFWRLLLNMGAKTNMGSFLPVFQAVLQKEGIEGAQSLVQCRAG